MELTQLRYFLQVYRLKNICGAAAQLNVTQQAVSRQILKLEEELGVELFARNSRGVTATAYADLLALEVQRFLPALDALVCDIQSKDKEVTGVVRLGVQCWQMSVEHGLKYDVLKAFERAYPRVHLMWENSIPKRCLDGLRERELDMAVMNLPPDAQGIELTPLCSTGWYMLMSAQHPLASSAALSVHDLAGQRIILAGNETAARSRIAMELEDREKPVFIGVEDFIFDLIAQQLEGEGGMMMTTEAVLGMFNPQRFAMVPLKGDLWLTQLYLARLQGVARTPAERVLYQYLLENWGTDPQ